MKGQHSNNSAAADKAQGAAVNPPFSKRAKVIAGVGAFILLLGGLIFAAMPKPAANTATVETRSIGSTSSAGRLAALTMAYNFGSISMARGKVSHRYLIRNTGAGPILIRKVYTSCMCTTAELVKGEKRSGPYGMPGHGRIPTINEPMKPGEDIIIEVVFDPAAHGPAGIGPVNRVVTVENSAGRPLELVLAASVTP